MRGLFLFLDLTGVRSFDVSKCRECLRRIPGTYNWHESGAEFELFSCEFDVADDSATVYMHRSDHKFVAIDGVGDASLQIAIEFQRRYGEEIHAVDTDFAFDIPISSVASLADFKEKMESEFGEHNL